MRQRRGSKATKAVFCLSAKKPLHTGGGFRAKADFFFEGGQLFPIPSPVFENLIPPSLAKMMMLCEKNKIKNRP